MATETTKEATAQKEKGDRPVYSIVQAVTDKDGKSEFKNVGGIWEWQTSKSGNKFANIRIGQLQLLLFENKQKE
jgi:hypothetical protein